MKKYLISNENSHKGRYETKSSSYISIVETDNSVRGVFAQIITDK